MSSYEELRDEATGDGADAWREADRETAKLRDTYERLKEDPRFTEEYRAEQAWEAFGAAEGKIAENKAKARELLAKQARTAERFSLPFPDQETPITTDTSKLLASQNEASRIVRKVDRAEAGGKKGPFRPDRLEVLRAEYGRGLEVGGVQGGAVCRGVLEAAEELGVDRHAVVDGYRKDRHRESFERAEHYGRLTDLIGGGVPEPPFAKPGSGRGSDFHAGGSKAIFLERERAAEGTGRRSGRRPQWK